MTEQLSPESDNVQCPREKMFNCVRKQACARPVFELYNLVIFGVNPLTPTIRAIPRGVGGRVDPWVGTALRTFKKLMKLEINDIPCTLTHREYDKLLN